MAAHLPALDSVETVQTAPELVPAFEQIKLRAYELWQIRARHGIVGTPEEDWLTAEKELSGHAATQASDS
jgi:hypothetical protein